VTCSDDPGLVQLAELSVILKGSWFSTCSISFLKDCLVLWGIGLLLSLEPKASVCRWFEGLEDSLS